MQGKAMRSLLLLAAIMGWPQTAVLGDELLPPRALARIGDHRFYHGPAIECAVLSPDGRRIASASDHPSSYRVIVIWDAATGERLRELKVTHPPVSHLAFSPDSKWIAAVCRISQEKRSVAVYEVETGKMRRIFGNFDRVEYLQFSADGKQLRVSEGFGPVSAWDPATGKQLRRWKPPPELPPAGNEKGESAGMGVLSPDGKVLVWGMHHSSRGDASSGSAGLRVHDAVTGKLLYRKEPVPAHRLESFAFSADGKRAAVACDSDKLRIWETATGKELMTLTVPSMFSFVLTQDGRRAVIHEFGANPQSRLLDLQSGKPLLDLCPGFLPMQEKLLRPQAISADGKTLLMASETTLRLFDLMTGKERAAPGHRAPVIPRFSADGRTLLTSCEERRCRWEVSGKKPALLRHEPRTNREFGCSIRSADGRFFLERSDNPDCVRETATGRLVCALEGRDNPGDGLFSPDSSWLLLWQQQGNDLPQLFRLYNAKSGKQSHAFQSLPALAPPVFSPDSRHLAWMDHACTIHIYDVSTGKIIRTLRSSQPLPKAEAEHIEANLLFSPDSERLTAAVYLWSVFDSEAKGGIAMPIQVFRLSTGREIARFYSDAEKTSKGGRITSMACSPDNRLLAVAVKGCGVIRLIEIASGKVRTEFRGHRHGVHNLAFSPDGKILASGGDDNVVFLWDVVGTRAPVKDKSPSELDAETCWKDLGSDDAKRAGLAIVSLLRKPQASVAFLQRRLHPTKEVDKSRLACLLGDLDSDDFETRQAASRELARLGERVESALRQALTHRPSLEMRRRLEDLLSKLEPTPPPAETLREIRAIEVLEHVGTPEARHCLQALKKGAIEARQTREAKQALERLMKHDASAKRRQSKIGIGYDALAPSVGCGDGIAGYGCARCQAAAAARYGSDRRSSLFSRSLSHR